MIPGMGGGGSLALNQLLVVMDGIDEPPFEEEASSRTASTRSSTRSTSSRAGSARCRLRLRPPKPRKEEIYFIGACNVPIETLDPALTRPGRMGRHIFFRTPTWEDRRDIFDLYITKVAHEEELDTPKKRDELARVTSGYSPAMIDQVCSMALTYAHAEGRPVFGWDDIVEAMTTVEAGVAIGQEYPPHEERATAIHEAGHAVCCAPLQREPPLDPAVDPQARLVGRPPPGDGDRGALRGLALGDVRPPDPRARRDGRRGRLLRPEHDRRGRRRPLGHVARRPHGRASRRWRRSASTSPTGSRTRERREAEEDRVMERFARIGSRSCTAPAAA